MPKFYKKRALRRVPRKRAAPRRSYRRSVVRPLKQGFLSVVRKHPLIAIQSTAAAGTPAVIDSGTGLTCVTLGTPTASVGTVGNFYDVPFSMTFAFNQLSGNSEFATLFDEYKFRRVRVQIQCNNNMAAVASTIGGQIGYLPYIEYINDHDDGVAPTTSNFRERMGIKTRYFNATTGMITMNCYPKVAVEVNSSVGTSQAVPGKYGTWIDMTDRTVPHYSIKGVIRRMYLPAGASTQSFNIDISSHVNLKGII